MSRGLQRVVDNFTKGLSIGWAHQDKQADRQNKIDMARFQQQKWSEQADLKRQEMGINSRKADAYVGLAGAQAGYYARKGAGGGAAAKSTDINPNTANWLNQSGGETLSTTQPAPAQLVVQQDAPPGPLPDPGSVGGGVSIDDKRGGKIPRLARGGRPNLGQSFSSGAQTGQRWATYQDQQAKAAPVDPVPPITRTSSTPTYQGPNPNGATGPGSGFGIVAAPPTGAQPQYRQGGRVQRMQAGGTPDPNIGSRADWLLGGMARALGIPKPGVARSGAQTPQEGRMVYDEQGKPVWMTPTGGGEAYNPQYGGARPGGNTYGGATPGGARPGGNTYGGATAGGATPGGNTFGGWRQRYPVHDTPTRDPGETGGFPDPNRPAPPPQVAAKDLPAYDNVYPKFDIDPSKVVQPTAAPARTGGGGGGYQARGGGLGDQRRTTAYDPVADRMDPRNTGIVYAPGEAPPGAQGNVNQQVYAAAQHGGIELNQPGQQIYRRGGPVRRFADGGPARFASNEPKLINPRVTPGNADIPVGRGRATVGLNYDPNSRYGAVEGGYEHPVGRDTTLGVYGNVGKDLGPEGASAKPDWGVGVRGRVRFEYGGRAPEVTQGDRLPVPAAGGREYRGGQPPQGGGEATSEGQAEADALTNQWRQEALATAQHNQQAAEKQPSDMGGGAAGPAVPGGDRQHGGNRYGGNTYGGNTYGGGRFGASAGQQGETGGQPETDRPMQVHGAASQPPSPGLSGPSQDDPARPPMQVHGASFPGPSPGLGGPSQDANVPYGPNNFQGPPPPQDGPPPDFGREAGSNLPPLPDAPPLPQPGQPPYEPGDTGKLPPQGGGEPHPANKPGPGGRPVATGRPQAAAGPAGPKGRKPLRDQTREEAFDPVADKQDPDNVNMVDDTGKVNPEQGPPAPGGKGAVDTKAPMAQGVGEPMGGQGLQGPGKNVSTNNAARDYLGAATTFADWALKDAGPQQKEQAQAALFSGKGAATTHEVGALMMAVDPENKMPLDKRFDAAVKLAHDFHIGEGDVKMAAESSFNVIQYGVTKAREHGAAAVKAIQGGDEAGALREIMSGYTWLADKATAAVKDGSIVVTGDDGKVRAQIPLQPGTVQNLAMGMMSGQLPWDAIRGGAAAAGDPQPQQPQQPKQAVNATPPQAQASGATSGSPAQSQAAPAAPAPAPAASASATPPAPPPALDTTPPQAQPKSPTPASAPASAAPGASRPSTPKPSQAPSTGGTPGKPDSVVRVKRPSADLMVPAPASASGPPSKVEPTPTDKGTESKTADKTDTTGGKDDEKDLKKWHDKNPYEPPPGKIESKTSPVSSGIKEVNDALTENRKNYEAGIAQIDKNAVDGKVPKADFAKYRPQLIAKLKEKHDHVRDQLEKQRDRVLDREMAAEQREREKPDREITHGDEEKFKETFKTRADEITKVEGRTPSQKAAAQKALDGSVLRYQIEPSERRELNNISRELWRTNRHFDTDKAFDTAVGLTTIYKEGKGMNLQTGEKATDFRPVAKTPKGDYVLLTSGGDKVTVDPTVYQRLLRLREQNWAQANSSTAQAEEAADKQARARKGLGGRALKALAYTNPFTFGPMVISDVNEAVRGEKK